MPNGWLKHSFKNLLFAVLLVQNCTETFLLLDRVCEAASCAEGNDSAPPALSCPSTLPSWDTAELCVSCSATIFQKKNKVIKFTLVLCGLHLNNLQYVPWRFLFFYRVPWAALETAEHETHTPAKRTLLCDLCYFPVFLPFLGRTVVKYGWNSVGF